jgi:hypothetical protein
MLPHLVPDRTAEDLLNHIFSLLNATAALAKAINSQAINPPVVLFV